MTAQVPDYVVMDGVEYAIAGVSGGGLFDPFALGILPATIHTACWRGYVCWYGVEDERLVLSRLVLGRDSRQHGGPIEPGTTLLGAATKVSDESTFRGSFELTGLHEPVRFTGGLLLGSGFVRSTYVHMGFHPAWRYESVVELLADEGRVTTRTDCSAEMAALRERIAAQDVADPDGGKADLHEWIAGTFTLDYSRSGR